MTLFRRSAASLPTPHVAVGSALDTALPQLKGLGALVEVKEPEYCYRVETPDFALAVFPDSSRIRSVWYDDPTGRGDPRGVEEKIEAYLIRYGPMKDWEIRLNNGLMHYWFNPKAHASMVYGLHKDVIRFNEYNQDA
jgi:hypothetical protein